MSSVRQNRFYNDPALGQAFSNLSQMFAPPSGGDLAGYATAQAKREEASRLAQLFSSGATPSEQAALTGVQGYGQTPQGFNYNVDQGNITARRGQDVTASTALSTNAADNVRALEQTRLGNTKDVTTALLSPVGAGATRFVPGSIADMYGLPETQTGVVNAGQGETLTLPDGRVIKGQDKPLTESEVQGAERQRLTESGQLTDQMLLDAIVGAETPVKATRDGKEVYMSPGEAVRTGAEAPASAEKALIEGTANVGGQAVQVFRKPNDSQYFTVDGVPVPPDVQVFDKARPVGTNDQIGMKNTEFSDRNAIFYNRASPADANMNALLKEGFVPNGKDYELLLGGAGEMMPMTVSNALVSDQGRQFYNSAMNFMLSVLRPDTGAAFGKEEFANYARVFIPLPGDDPQTIANKATARSTALAALQGTSRGAADQITQMMQAQGLTIPPEMAARLEANKRTQARQPAPGQPAPAQPAAAPPPAPAQAGGRPEGTVIRNEQTGEQMIRRNGKWEPHG